ncbi:MAG: hypothetical protein QOI48_1087 [Solirubrobacteraceae bacterium]|jgi:hypothetical protein|nr:hypothetical protein [Solirubrobacteraceae bacterium]
MLAFAAIALTLLGVLWSGCGEPSGGDGRLTAAKDRPRSDPRIHAGPPLLDPDVVGPRLVQESFGPQLLFWLRTYRGREGGRVRRSWSSAARGTVVIVRMSAKRGRRPPWRLEARWKIAVALDRQLTRRQLTILGGRRGIVPDNDAARRLSSFPRIDPSRGPRSRPLALVAQVRSVDPRGRRIGASVLPAESMVDGLVTRNGRDFALLAGLTLIKHTRPAAFTSHVLAAAARITAGSERITARRLAALAGRRSDALVILSWRHAGRLSLARLLARPVDGIELIGVQ